MGFVAGRRQGNLKSGNGIPVYSLNQYVFFFDTDTDTDTHFVEKKRCSVFSRLTLFTGNNP